MNTRHAGVPTSADGLAAWPALTFEDRPWTVDEGVSRSAHRKHAGPYSAAVVPPIADANLSLTAELAADVAEAEAAVTRFDEYVSSTLGAHTSELAPISTILLRTESASSSQIENLTVGARQIALVALGEVASHNASIVNGNVRTMEAALGLASELDLDSILQLHHTLLATSDPHNAGRLREQQVWIGGSSVGPHRAAFVPPHHDRVRSSLEDLFAYVRREDVPTLAHAAIAHAQFETIHPFTDGNGRTGRALVHAVLTHREVTTRSTVPVSAGLLRDVDRYFGALGEYRQGRPAAIIERFCDASRFAARRGRELVDELRAVRDSNRERITARADAAAWPLNDSLIGQPVVNTAYVVKALGISRPAADRAIRQLVDAGVLVETSNKGRNRVWQSNDILHALDDFAAGIRRPRSGG